MSATNHLRIALVTGGRSGERDRSLISGEAVRESLVRQGLAHVVLDPTDKDFADRVRETDVAFLAIAGQWAEDGKLQGLLDSLGVPYTGSGVLASATAMHKPTAKTLVQAGGVNVLPHIPLQGTQGPTEAANACAEELGLPVILKPASEGGSIGMRVFRDLNSLATTLTHDTRGGEWFVEPFKEGTAVTCGVLEQGGALLALPPLETVPTTADFYDYRAKRNPAGHRYRCPAQLPDTTLATISGAALRAHQQLGCSGYSRSDFLVTADGAVHWLEINTLPGLSPHGNLATMAAAAGISYDQLIQTMLTTAHTDGYRP
ncbi:D-alanine--D-alanine ligase family protein [Kitasatospora purpeofusca]|uniref:D-alanine--D-alanine ligase family protein n=1 Tax=Kitasatospora purpeofusca TaxID=67352 RepID=UPI003683D5AA